MRRIAFLIVLLLVPAAARAGTLPFAFSGYLKYLSSVSDVPALPGTLYDQEVHARINTAWQPDNPAWRGEADLRLQAFYGDSVAKVPDFAAVVTTDYEFANLDATMRHGTRSFGYGQIDRLWLDYTRGDLEATIGRQRVAWGTALVWNVIDLFNPKSVLDFDYEEKPGTDGLRLQYYRSALSRVELVGKPAKEWDKTIIAGLYSFNAHAYDFYAIAGVRNNRWLAGGAWAGSVLDGGFRGEVLVSQSPTEVEEAGANRPSAFAANGAVVSLVVSADYTFANTFYILSECLYNSNGKTENGGLYAKEAMAADLLSPARWSLYQEFAYDINPLTRATLYAIYNPHDHSSIVVPQLNRSLTTNLELLAIGQFASGRPTSEFGDYGKSLTIRLKYSF